MRVLLMVGLLVASAGVGLAYADDSWESSISNWDNSPSNWENSPSNWRNSPANWENSRANRNRWSAHDEEGRSFGYVVPRRDGGANIFSDDGERIGYIPARRRR